MTGYAFKLAGAAILIVALGFLGLIIFDRLWMRLGIGAAAVIVFGGLLLLAWLADRREKARRDESEREALEDLQRI
jgi:hypothetical protein